MCKMGEMGSTNTDGKAINFWITSSNACKSFADGCTVALVQKNKNPFFINYLA